MDTFEYCSLRLRLFGVTSLDIGTPGLGDAVLILTTDKVEEIVLKDVASLIETKDEWTDTRGRPCYRITKRRCLLGSPLESIQPYFSKLGKEGWDVVEYKSSPADNFAEALLKRRVQKNE